MQKRYYVGPYDEVELDATGDVVRRGEYVEVDDDLAELLDQQPTNWAKPNTKAAKQADAPAPAAPADPPVTFDGVLVDAGPEEQEDVPSSDVTDSPAAPSAGTVEGSDQ